MGFNTQIRRATNEQLALGRRYTSLRSALERFSPNGFNVTFANLQQATGVTDPASWSGAEIARAAKLLSRSRAHYLRHQEIWHEERRSRKSNGEAQPTSEELDARNDRSWFDAVSWSSTPSRYRWGRLADWVRENNIKPDAFGPSVRDDHRTFLHKTGPSRLAPSGLLLAHYGRFASHLDPPNVIGIPYRIYDDPITEAGNSKLSAQERLVADCWHSRSHDGYIRQRHLRRIVAIEEYWVIPYVLAGLGDYVVEIVHEVETGLKGHWKTGTWHHSAYRLFASENHEFLELMRQRATSYRACYYPYSYARSTDASDSPIYPAFSVLDLLGHGDNYPRQYWLPKR